MPAQTSAFLSRTLLHQELGDRDSAFAALDRAVSDRSTTVGDVRGLVSDDET